MYGVMFLEGSQPSKVTHVLKKKKKKIYVFFHLVTRQIVFLPTTGTGTLPMCFAMFCTLLLAIYFDLFSLHIQILVCFLYLFSLIKKIMEHTINNSIRNAHILKTRLSKVGMKMQRQG